MGYLPLTLHRGDSDDSGYVAEHRERAQSIQGGATMIYQSDWDNMTEAERIHASWCNCGGSCRLEDGDCDELDCGNNPQS